mgnify:CR=1 FL=1
MNVLLCNLIRPAKHSPLRPPTDFIMQIPVPVTTVGLLFCSNLFMTFAWYGHLRYRSTALPIVIITSWAIAFFEYVLQVPANRIGYGYFSAAELKTIQEIISLSVFMVFSTLWLHEPMRWNHAVGFGLIVLAAWVIFKEW